MERFFDLVFSSLALVILSPLLFPIIVILRLSGEGEIFSYKTGLEKMGRFLSFLNLQLCSKIVLILVPVP